MLPIKNHSRLIFSTTALLLSGLSPCLSSEGITHYNFSSINPGSLGSPFCAGGYNANAMTGVDNNSMGQPFRQTFTNNSNNNTPTGGYVGFNFSTIDKGGAAFSHAFAPEHTDTVVQPQSALTGQTDTTPQQNLPSSIVPSPQPFTPTHASSPQVHKSFQAGEPQDLQPAPLGDSDTTINGMNPLK